MRTNSQTVSYIIVSLVLILTAGTVYADVPDGIVQHTVESIAASYPTGFYAAVYSESETRHLYNETLYEKQMKMDTTYRPDEFYAALSQPQREQIVKNMISWLSPQSQDEIRWHLRLLQRWAITAVQFEMISTYLSETRLIEGLYDTDATRSAFEAILENRGWKGEDIDSQLVAETLSSAESAMIRFEAADIISRMNLDKQARIFSYLWYNDR